MDTPFDDLIPQQNKVAGGNPFSDLVPKQPGVIDRAKSALSSAFSTAVNFIENPPAAQIVARNRAAGRPQPDAFGSVSETVPDTDQGGAAVRAASDPAALTAAARHAGRSAAPSLGGAAGFGAGFATGGTLTAPAEAIPVAGPIINALGAFGGGLLGAYGGSSAVDAAQEKVLSLLPDSIVQALGQDTATRKADEAEHPIASFSGSLAPMLLTMRPGMVESAPQDANLLTRVLSHPVGSRAVGATLMGGQEAAREELSGDGIDPEKVAIASGVGATLNRPTTIGSRLFEAGGNAAIRTMTGAARAAGRMFNGGPDTGARQEFDTESTASPVAPDNRQLPAPAPVPPATGPFTDLVPVKAPGVAVAPTPPVAPQPAIGAAPADDSEPGNAAAAGDAVAPPEPATEHPADFMPANPVDASKGVEVLGRKDFGSQDKNGDYYTDDAKSAKSIDRVKAALAEGRPVNYVMDDQGAQPIVAVKDGKLIKEDGTPLGMVALSVEHPDYYRLEIGAKPTAAPTTPVALVAGRTDAPQGASVASEPQPLQEGEQYVRTPAGNKVRTRAEVVDAATLNKATGSLQNRDRSRDTTALQVQDIVGKFDPELLGEDPSSDRGAPIVAPDHTVLSGNGRMLALNQVYDAHPDKAAAYRQFIESQGHSTEGMDRPVLIRRVTQDMTPEEARQFVIESNTDNKLELSPVERARSDADSVTPQMLDKYAGGDLNSTANKGFVTEFLKARSAAELGGILEAKDRLSTAGVERIENAVVAKAYDHPKLLEKLMESSHNEIRAITSSLANVAPAWAKMRATAKAGEIGDHYDITHDLADAAMRVAEARRAGTKPADILTQIDAFDRPSPIAERLIEAFYTPGMKRPASVKSVTNFLQDYIDEARAQKAGVDMFGESSPGKAPADILNGLLQQRDGGGDAPLLDALSKEKGHDTSRAPRGHEESDQGSPRGQIEEAPAEGQAATRGAGEGNGGRPAEPGRGSGGSPADRGDEALESSGAYDRAHSKGATTDRPSDLRSAVEHLGMTWDDFNLKAPPTQMQLLQRAIHDKLGITVTVDHGELGPSRASVPYRIAIDQMLDGFHNITGMAAVLGLPEKAMSLGGTLTLELRKKAQFYGAYYPGEEKIALPGRANSFAHEWGHALDYYLLGQMGGDGSLSGFVRKQGNGELRGSPEIAARFTDLMNTMFFDKAELAGKIMALESKIAATKSEKVKEQLQRQVERIKAGAGQHRTGRTAYYKNAKAVDGPIGEPGGGYWQKPTEMLARAFEAYVANKAADAGMSTEVISHSDADYLSNADDRLAMTFPKGEERQAIFDAYDDLFGAIADAGTLGKGEAASIPNNPERRAEPTQYQRNVFKRVVHNELSAFADWARSHEKAAGQPKDPKSFAQKANDVRHFFFSGMAAEMRALGKRWNSKAIAQLHDLLVSEAGKGNRMQSRDFIMARRLRHNRYTNSIERALLDRGPATAEGARNHATVLSKAQAEDVRMAMVNEHHQMAFPELKPLASRLREISDGIWHDLRATGFNIGYARNGHLPRMYEPAKAKEDMSGFLSAARQVYEAAGLEAEEARLAAAQWYSRLTTGSPHEFDQHTPAGDFLKGRALPPEADTLMADFMATEPVDLMRRYAEAAAHRIEWAKRFGVQNEKLNALYDQMGREHVDARDVATIKTMLDIMSGNNPMRQKDPTLNALGAGFNTIYGTVALLGRAVFQSLAESVTSGIVLENPVYGISAMANLVEGALGTATAKERREIAELIGLVDMTNHTRLLADRFGGSYDDPVSFQKINNKLFYNTGLIALTRAQYTHNMAVVNSYLIQLSKKLLSAKEGSGSEREVLQRFNELGIRDPRPFAQWMTGHAAPGALKRNKLPSKAELAQGLDERDSAPWAFDWITATRRLSERIIQDPHGMTKPRLSHAGNVGRLVTGIQAFNYSFYENVLKAAFKRASERVKDGRPGYAFAAGAATLAAFGTLYAGQLLATTLRVYLTDRGRWDEEKKNGTLFSYLAKRTATNFIGDPLDPVVQAGTGLKYNRPLGASFEGPAGGNFLANASDIVMLTARNSRKTNAGEFNAVNGAYRIMSPWASAAVGAVPAGPLLSAVEGGAQGYLTSPQAGRDAATAIVGTKNGRVGDDGKKSKSGPTGYDHALDNMFGPVERKKKAAVANPYQ